MKRRGARDNQSSLFAFQDVMASLIGILFFIVLFMALDMVEQGHSTPPPDGNGEPSLKDLKGMLAEVRRQRDELDREIRAVTERLNVASMSNDAILEAIQDMRKKLLHLGPEIERAVSELDEEISEARKADLATDGVEEDLRKLKEEIGRLNAKAKTFRAMPRVTYIIDEATDLEPWLVEVTGKRIRVAAKDGTSSVMSFTAATALERREQFLAWAKSQDPRKQYFVVLSKPSGWEESVEIGDVLTKKRGFRLGRDLLPENWEPFDGE